MDEGQIAEIVAEILTNASLSWGADNAASSLFVDVMGLDVGEVAITTVGGERFRMVVERVTDEDEAHFDISPEGRAK